MRRHARGLCGYLARKHKWSKSKEDNCARKAGKKHRRRGRRRSRGVNPFAVCGAQKKKFGWGHKKWKSCVRKVSRRNR